MTHRRPLRIDHLNVEQLNERRERYGQSRFDERLLYRYDWHFAEGFGDWTVIEFPALFILQEDDELETGILDHSLTDIVWGHNIDWAECRRVGDVFSCWPLKSVENLSGKSLVYQGPANACDK